MTLPQKTTSIRPWTLRSGHSRKTKQTRRLCRSTSGRSRRTELVAHKASMRHRGLSQSFRAGHGFPQRAVPHRRAHVGQCPHMTPGGCIYLGRLPATTGVHRINALTRSGHSGTTGPARVATGTRALELDPWHRLVQQSRRPSGPWRRSEPVPQKASMRHRGLSQSFSRGR